MAQKNAQKKIVKRHESIQRARIIVTSRMIDRAQTAVDKARATLSKSSVRLDEMKGKLALAIAKAKQTKRPAAKLAAAKVRAATAQATHAKRAAALQLRETLATMKAAIKEETTHQQAAQRSALQEKRRVVAKARAMTAFEKHWDKGWASNNRKKAKGRSRTAPGALLAGTAAGQATT